MKEHKESEEIKEATIDINLQQEVEKIIKDKPLFDQFYEEEFES